MQVQKIHDLLDNFATHLSKDQTWSYKYTYDCAQQWDKYWDLNAPDLKECYNTALQSNVSKRLWLRDAWHPKEMMLKFLDLDQEFVRRMFQRLFNEEKEITARISQFKFAADELLQDYKSKHKSSVENAHYHDDARMIFTYLAFQFPNRYCIYHYEAFAKTCMKIGVIDIPQAYDLDRFLKISKVLFTFMQKHEGLKVNFEERNARFGVNNPFDKMLLFELFNYCTKL